MHSTGFYSTQLLQCECTCAPPHDGFTVPFVLFPNLVSAGMIVSGVKMGRRSVKVHTGPPNLPVLEER